MDMNALNKQELQIIEVFSSVNIPEKIIRDSNIKELINGMLSAQDAVATNAEQLAQLRREKKEGNFLGNWWDDRGEKIQDAQLDLNQTIGRLTAKSSQLLIVNTAISKVLTDQQRILLEQQNILKQQTNTLEQQNRKILEQQNLLEKQQQDINKANHGLLEAKGITQEQAQQLVGCVKLVKEAESRISVESQALKSDVKKSLLDSVEQCLGRLNSGFAEQQQRAGAFEQQVIDGFSTQALRAQETLEQITAENTQRKAAIQEQLATTVTALEQHREVLEQQLTTAFSNQSQHTQAELAHFASDTADFKVDIGQQLQLHIQSVLEKVSVQDVTAKLLHEAVKGVEQKQEASLNEQTKMLKATETQLTALQAEQQRGARSNHLAVAVTATLALVSLGWQVAQHFALV